MKYKHLTQEERYHIAAYKKAGYKQKDMAIEFLDTGVNIGNLKNSKNRINKTLLQNDLEIVFR